MSKTTTQSQTEIGFSDMLSGFLTKKPDNITESSAETYKYGIKKFKEWMDSEGLTLQQLNKVVVDGFGDWLEDQNYTDSTLESYSKATRKFLDYCEGKDAVAVGVSDEIKQFTADEDARQWDQDIDRERIDETVELLEDAYYPRRNVLIWRLLAATGLRRSGLRALDVEDVYFHKGRPVLDVQNRENTGLKGGDKHERFVYISMDLFEDLKAYVGGGGEHSRIDVEDEYGRKPLFTTEHGRASVGLIVDTVHYFSSPHITGVDECDCEVGPNPNKHETKKCDKSFSPHALRAYHVTKLRNSDVRMDKIGKRVACGVDTLESHYVRSTKEEEAERRREALEDFL